MKKLLIILITTAILLTGCTGNNKSKELIEATQNAFNEGVSYKQEVNLDMSLNYMGSTINLATTMYNEVEVKNEKARMLQTILSRGQKTEIETYIIDGVSYIKENDTWYKDDSKPTEVYGILPEIKDLNSKIEEEEYDGLSCYKVTSTMDLGSTFSSMNASDAGKVPAYYYFRKDNNALVGVYADVTGHIKSVLNDGFKEELGDASEDNIVDVKSCIIKVTDINTDNIQEIVLPEEAKSAVDISTLEEQKTEEEKEVVPVKWNDEWNVIKALDTEIKLGETKAKDIADKVDIDTSKPLSGGMMEYLDVDGKSSFSLIVVNSSEKEASLGELPIYGAALKEGYVDNISIAGIKIKDARSDVIERLGEPTMIDKFNEGETLTWLSEDNKLISVLIQEDVVTMINILL